MTWQDLLADQVRELEAQRNGFDPELANQARALVRTLRGYEVRVRQIALRSDNRDLFRARRIQGR